MKSLKNIYSKLLLILPFVSVALAFLILQPTGVVGIGMTLLIGIITYFFLWVMAQIITPNLKYQYVKVRNKSNQ